jgi:nucleoside-diphosphate-sugar epimerase
MVQAEIGRWIMKIVVTGGSGALGRAVIAELSTHGHDVLNLDRRPHPDGFRPTWAADLTDSGTLYQACRGAAGLVHLAAYMAPNLTADTDTFNTNVAITYNALKAASDMGVTRAVTASSTAAYGFIYGPDGLAPDYLPIDEDHPSRPTDAYGLSKVVGERIADAIVAGGAMSVASLRFPGVNIDPDYRILAHRMDDPGARRSGFWAYIDVRDAATACRLALEAELDGHQVLNVAAPDTSMRQPTEDLIRDYFPGVADLRPGQGSHWSGVDSSRAARLIGFRARHGWRDQLAE